MVKINRQFQDLHSTAQAEIDWSAIQRVERDICLLYHQLADYSYIMGDLYYGDVFNLPYWEYLDFQGPEPEQQEFIRSGCLVMLYAMASEVLDGSGAYLTMDRDRFSGARASVESLRELDGDTGRLAAVVRAALRLVGQEGDLRCSSPEVQEIEAESTWIHERFVREYFNRRTHEFESNAYYQGEIPE
ncbi:MAG: hypothetical protein GY719_26540 [bacterium]|nr:hypothetical protein [bacterium]